MGGKRCEAPTATSSCCGGNTAPEPNIKSAQAAQFLQRMGMSRVKPVRDGIHLWMHI